MGLFSFDTTITFLFIILSFFVIYITQIINHFVDIEKIWKISNYSQYNNINLEYYENINLNTTKNCSKQNINININDKQYDTLENASYVIDIILGLLFILLPLLNYYNIGNNLEEFIKAICCLIGAIGFILTIHNISPAHNFQNEKQEKKLDIANISSYSLNKSKENISYYKLDKNKNIEKKIKKKENKNIDNTLNNFKDGEISLFFNSFTIPENQNNIENNYIRINFPRLLFALLILIFYILLGISGLKIYLQNNDTKKIEKFRFKKIKKYKH